MARHIAIFSIIAFACFLQAATAAPRTEGVFDDLFEGLKGAAQIPIDIAQKKAEIADKVVTKVGEKVEQGINTAQNIFNQGLHNLDNLFHTIVNGNSKTSRDATQYFVDQGVRFGVRRTPNGFYIIGFVPDSSVYGRQ